MVSCSSDYAELQQLSSFNAIDAAQNLAHRLINRNVHCSISGLRSLGRNQAIQAMKNALGDLGNAQASASVIFDQWPLMQCVEVKIRDLRGDVNNENQVYFKAEIEDGKRFYPIPRGADCEVIIYLKCSMSRESRQKEVDDVAKGRKRISWWAILTSPAEHDLLALRKLGTTNLNSRHMEVTLQFSAPEVARDSWPLELLVKNDSVLGIDICFELPLRIY
jgi:hypothetical protein